MVIHPINLGLLVIGAICGIYFANEVPNYEGYNIVYLILSLPLSTVTVLVGLYFDRKLTSNCSSWSKPSLSVPPHIFKESPTFSLIVGYSFLLFGVFGLASKVISEEPDMSYMAFIIFAASGLVIGSYMSKKLFSSWYE